MKVKKTDQCKPSEVIQKVYSRDKVIHIDLTVNWAGWRSNKGDDRRSRVRLLREGWREIAVIRVCGL